MDSPNAFYTVKELRRRLSISTTVFWQHQPVGHAALEALAAAGIRKIELAESREQFDMANIDSMKLIGEACRSCGVEVAAYHAWFTTFEGVETESQRQELVGFCRRQIDTMLELGGNVWGSHMGVGGPDDPTWKKSYLELAQHVEGTDACIVIENGGVEHVLSGLDEIDHPKVGMVFDIGHEYNEDGENVMCIPGEPAKLINRCQKHLLHMHMHGFRREDGRQKDHHPPFCDGDGIQWLELFEALHATGYSGHMNFEPGSWPDARPGSIEAVGSVPERIVAMATQKR